MEIFLFRVVLLRLSLVVCGGNTWWIINSYLYLSDLEHLPWIFLYSGCRGLYMKLG